MTDSRSFTDRDELWRVFNEAHDKISGTEPGKARRAGFDAVLAMLGGAQGTQEPVGYGYSAEIQSSHGDQFTVSREQKHHYDTPLYTQPVDPAYTSRMEELERRVAAHEQLQARIVQALGRETWEGDLSVAVEAEVARANGNGKSCSEAFKMLELIRNSADETLRMPWVMGGPVSSTDGATP